ncbi:hypothetical protein AB0P06_36125, partial [Kitasatospora sp. NPDC088351]
MTHHHPRPRSARYPRPIGRSPIRPAQPARCPRAARASSRRSRGPRSEGAGSTGAKAGMAERVGLYEGTLDAGPLPGGGFRVRAVLPL